MAKSRFPSKSPSIWRPGLPVHLVSTAGALVFQGFRPRGPQRSRNYFQGRLSCVCPRTTQIRRGSDQSCHVHPRCDVVICKQLIQIYSLTAIFYCQVCGGGRGGLGQMSRSSALWNRIAEKPFCLDHCAESLCCQEPTSLILLQAQIYPADVQFRGNLFTAAGHFNYRKNINNKFLILDTFLTVLVTENNVLGPYPRPTESVESVPLTSLWLDQGLSFLK